MQVKQRKPYTGLTYDNEKEEAVEKKEEDQIKKRIEILHRNCTIEQKQQIHGNEEVCEQALDQAICNSQLALQCPAMQSEFEFEKGAAHSKNSQVL